jgi:hypothetical protein
MNSMIDEWKDKIKRSKRNSPNARTSALAPSKLNSSLTDGEIKRQQDLVGPE